MNRRRQLLAAAAALPALALPIPGRARPTPACGDETPPQMAGPFARSALPVRQDLRPPNAAGRPLRLTGNVLDTACQPLRDLSLAFWHADPEGRYHPETLAFYGRQPSPDGRYALDTLAPGPYPGRVPHLHVAIHDAAGRLRLVTQLYFPDEPGNRRDFLFDPALLMHVEDRPGLRLAHFDFVLADIP